MTRVAKRLRRLRKREGWSQSELAKRARLHRIFVLRLETGRHHDPSLLTLRKLARALGVKTSELVD